MPGILYHLACGEEVFRKLDLRVDKIEFMAGNLIPDLATDKKLSHYRKEASVKGFFVPEVRAVKRDLLDFQSPIKLGMYCHLILDYYFIESFLIPEFIWDEKRMMVVNPRNHKEWTVKQFFSQDGMYGAYTEINQLLLRDGRISQATVIGLPTILPNTGIEVYDKRREKTWRQELEEYFAQKKQYTGDIFDYYRLWGAIDRISTEIAYKISNC